MEQLYKTAISAGTGLLRRLLPDQKWPWNASHRHVEASIFLQLPKEVRDMILGYLLLEADRIIVYHERHVGCYVYRRETESRFRDVLDHRRWGNAFYIPPNTRNTVQNPTTHQRMLELSLVCQQLRFEAQEMFFCRNRFILLTTPRSGSRLIELHSRWVSKVSLWCRPSLGLSKLVWLSVDVERVQRPHMFEIRWSQFRYDDEDDDFDVSDGSWVQPVVQEWINKSHALLLDKLRASLAEKGAQLDLNVLIDFFGGPPKCKQMFLCICPEPVGRIQLQD